MILLLQMLIELLEPKVSRAARPQFWQSNNTRTDSSKTYPKDWDADKIVVTLDPAAVAAFQESERVKKALRGL